jgi:hypothetical protein
MYEQVAQQTPERSGRKSGSADATTTKPPRYPWRITRADGSVNHYGSEARRNSGARNHADTDQKPVTCERWTAERGWFADLVGTGTEQSRSFERHLVDGVGWVNDSGVVEPSCQCVSGTRAPFRCGMVPVVDQTGYCLGHQHVYRLVNGIPEPPRPRRNAPVETGNPVVAAPLSDAQLCAIAEDGTVVVDVRCDDLSTYIEAHPGAQPQEGHGDFARYLGERITGRAIPGIIYFEAAPRSTTYTVRFDLDPDVYLRQARQVNGGRDRHGAVKHARDRRRAALKHEARGVVVDLEIDNEYELYPDVTSYVHHARIPSPPAEHDEVAYGNWKYPQLVDRSDTGRYRGDSWYRGEITWASDPALIGRTF